MTSNGGGGGSSRGKGNYTNPCLTMHQPWASLLVHGIKRVEGRSWPAPIRGRLWIHAASKVPEADTIKAMEEFYRQIYSTDGVTDLKFPEYYPTSRLLGCVEVVDCVKSDELANWNGLPNGVRLEAVTDYCWLCEQPQKLVVPFEMRGFQGVYNLERRVFEGAMRGLFPVQSPFPVKFPLHITAHVSSSRSGTDSSTLQKSANVGAAIAGARSAAKQFSKDHGSAGTT